MKHTLPVALAVIALAGCASEHMNDGLLTSLIGLNIRSASARLGPPGSQHILQGYTIYVWNYSRNASIPYLPPNTIAMNFAPTNYNCTIQLATDTGGTIKGYKWSGSFGGCDTYGNALTHSQSSQSNFTKATPRAARSQITSARFSFAYLEGKFISK